MEETRILDGQRFVEDDPELTDWFVERDIPTRVVLVDTIRQSVVTTRGGRVKGYRVTWKEAVLTLDGGYEVNEDGTLVTRDRALRSKTPALR